MINVITANLDDYSAIRSFDPHSRYLDPQRVKAKLNQQEIMIAITSEKIVGLLKFTYLWMTRPYIDLIFVDSKSRGKGISTLLLKSLEKRLVNEGVAYLFSSSEEDDTTAQNWHKHMGFHRIGKLKDLNLPHDKTSEIFYSKKISDSSKLREYPI